MKKIKSFLAILKNQFFYMVFFASMFTIIGYYLPRVYFQYIDKTIYYSFNNPLKFDKKEYKKCEIITMTIDRKSLVEGDAISIKNLFLIENQKEIRINSQKVDVYLGKGTGAMYSNWHLPCDIGKGNYYYRGNLTYEINGVEKKASFYTENFKIIN